MMLAAAPAAGAGIGIHEMPRDSVSLIQAFNATFSVAIYDPVVIKHLRETPLVCTWYDEWRAERANEEALPDYWRTLGITATEWAEIQALRAARRHIRAATVQEVAQAALAFQQSLRAIAVECHGSLAATITPLAKVVEARYPQLPAERQRVVDMSIDQKALAPELAAARREWLATVRGGGDPLPGWVGCSERCKLCRQGG